MSNYNEILRIYENSERFFELPGVVKHSKHGLRSGGRGAGYIDFDILVNNLTISHDIVRLFAHEVARIAAQREIDFLGFLQKGSGGTVGALRLAAAISARTAIPNIVVRPGKDLHFERVKVDEHRERALRARLLGIQGILITDHCTRGKEALKAVEAVEELGGTITDVIAFTSYPQKVELRRFEEKSIELHSIFHAYQLTGEKEEVKFEIARKGERMYEEDINIDISTGG